MALIPLDIEHPVCCYCGKPLEVGDHCLLLEGDEGIFDAHAECHDRDMNTPDEDEPLSVH